jgi:hypothetical protein
MAHHRKQLERRTYSQDRYYILIKRQKAGTATFKELTELDEIVNRVPDIRDIVIRESFGEGEQDTTTDTPGNSDVVYQKHPAAPTFWGRLKDIINRVFTSHTSALDDNLLFPTFKNPVIHSC